MYEFGNTILTLRNTTDLYTLIFDGENRLSQRQNKERLCKTSVQNYNKQSETALKRCIYVQQEVND